MVEILDYNAAKQIVDSAIDDGLFYLAVLVGYATIVFLMLT